LFYAETLYGNFNHPVLRQLRFTCYERAKEYQTKLNEAFLLVGKHWDAEKQSIGSPEASQQASEIANILKADTVYKPLRHLLDAPRQYAEYLEEMDNNHPSWPETLEMLRDRLRLFKGDVDSLISYADYKRRGGTGRKPA
jgi:hypothetical protein